MPIRVTKVAELVGAEIVLSVRHQSRAASEFAAMLAILEPANLPGPNWALEITIGEGPAKKTVTITLASILTQQQYESSNNEPVPINPLLRIFRNRFFCLDRIARTITEHEEVALRAKKIVYDEEGELTALRSFVSNVEAAVEYQKTGPKRDPIPDDVKLLVWSRDGGACIRCGSKDQLHFDHIIPVAKGGSNLPVNIQLLCQTCNLKKSDKIAF